MRKHFNNRAGNINGWTGFKADLFEVKVPERVTSKVTRPPLVAAEAPDFVKKFTAVIMGNSFRGGPQIANESTGQVEVLGNVNRI